MQKYIKSGGILCGRVPYQAICYKLNNTTIALQQG